MRKLNFPSYEWLKALPLKRTYKYTNAVGRTWEEEGICEYRFILFDTPVNVFGQLTYNDDDSRYLYFDVMEDGYSGRNDWGLELKFNKANYQKICKHAQKIYEMFYRELDKDVSYQWDCTPEEYFENKYGGF